MSGRGFLDVRTPMFRPLWVRVVVTAALTGWAIFELLNGNLFWAILFGAAGLYLAWALLVAWDPAALDQPDDTTGDDR